MAAQIRDIDVATLKSWLDRGEAVLVDVREPAEYARERISGARLMPLSGIEAATLPALEGKRLVLSCATGVRSAQAAQKLAARGVADIACFKGGLVQWKQAGLPVEGDPSAPLPVMRQVQIVAGALAFLGVALGFAVHPWFFLLSGFVGLGLLFAGITGNCMMANLLLKLPYNRAQRA